jgi:hypothetical protein
MGQSPFRQGETLRRTISNLRFNYLFQQIQGLFSAFMDRL